jgi:VanZ family protein
VLTSVPGRDVPDVGVPHIDKVVHFAMYAVLGVLLARALGGKRAMARGVARPAVRALAVAVVAVALFAAADEWHQRWVPGRSTDVLDWCADVAGGTLALLLAARPVARPEHLT